VALAIIATRENPVSFPFTISIFVLHY